MDTNYNRIKVADLETNQPNKTLATNENGELEFIDISENLSDPVSATTLGIVDNTSLQELGGVDKTINGIRIGKGNSDIENNTALGYLTLTNNTTGNYNTSVGGKSMHINTTGIRNTAVGTSSLYNNITGSRNTTIGSTSLYYNIDGSSNSAVGSQALFSNTSGSGNTAIGIDTLVKNTIGQYNTAVGYRASYYCTNGQHNVAVGNTALGSNTGQGNTAIGAGAGSRINSNFNIAVGYNAFGENPIVNAPVTGEYNIIMGFQAGRDLTAGSRNILIENTTNASVTTGNNNIMLNPRQKSGINTGSGNTIIGGFDGAFNSNDSELVVLGSGTGTIAIRKNTNNELIAPTLTNALIISGGNKSLITKEYLESVTKNLPSLTTANAAPTSSTASGVKGDIRIDADYVYICVATNTWKRSLLTAW